MKAFVPVVQREIPGTSAFNEDSYQKAMDFHQQTA